MNFGFLTECYVREGKSHAQAFADTFAQVDEAEALGLDSVWMVEQHFRPWASILPSPMLMASREFRPRCVDTFHNHALLARR